ncbi:homocysteine S-methyltransferase 1 [Parambassis ranga]|uniref:Homocysteine S-methyltransferase 1 n=1 Tax=Parambassis ranga TaxID=210632 RepID=A0A6P7HU92_9TELE|nr:homocysteine S-methyltransferase 1-like [Parambassis ranga]
MGSSVGLRHFIRENGPLILDGGLATDLETQGIKLQGDPLWSARLLHTDPQAIRDCHYRFLLSGADIITTATYQASIPGFVRHLDVTADRARELLMSGVLLAKDTVKRFETGQRCPLVAGSVGPYGASLHDGSEYTGAYAQEMSIEELKAWHRPQVDCLEAAGADLIAFETIPSLKEAEAVVELLREFPNCKAWLSFSCKDDRCISDGSPFCSAVQVAKTSTQLLAVGVNCCSPAVVEPLLHSARSQLSPDISWVVYPNSGEEWDTERGWQTSRKSSASIPELSHTWLKQGAALIGGCCRISPAHIAEIRQQLKGCFRTAQGQGQHE